MKTTRRTFLGGVAVASLPVVDATSAVIHPSETQEEKCRRLVHELVEEFRKLPRQRESMFGWNVDLPMPDGSHIGHAIGRNDHIFSEQLTIFLRSPGGES